MGVAPVAKVGVASAAPPPPPEPSRQPSSASRSTPAPASLPHHGSRGGHQPYVPCRPLRHAKLVADKAIKKKAIQQQRPEEGQENEEEGVIQGIAAALASALPQVAPRRRCRDSVDTLLEEAHRFEPTQNKRTLRPLDAPLMSGQEYPAAKLQYRLV